MAKTTIEDERSSMQPRMGSALGCPFGQEVELSDMALTLSGNEFYWTVAAPLAEFEVTDKGTFGNMKMVSYWNKINNPVFSW